MSRLSTSQTCPGEILSYLLLTLLLAFFGQSAHGGEVAVSAVGGQDYLTANPWVGADITLHPSRADGWEAVGRITPSWGLKDDTVLLFTEIGVVKTIPNEQATIRTGIVGRGVSYFGAYTLPIQPGGRPQSGTAPRWGLVPGGYALLEFDMGTLSPFTVGFHAGVGSAAADYGCTEEVDPMECIFWDPAFIGGFVTRYRHKSGFVLDARLGPSARLALGWRFPSKK